ncbi:Lactoylglutathione lyase [Coemansia interrupta]|uniref:Lactoylglutathione lyase n=1 Tax=Coemansia interrupta TaxID=1126814 RepID=A0A9W8LKE0_9FUNG|nr:Lactoylglutathione lyase [Coemansia interrupta]
MATDLSTYRLNHTMYRVKDPKASLKFYSEVLGMSTIDEIHNVDARFSLYFLGYNDPASKGLVRRARQGILELTHNHGTEDDEGFTYNTGNGSSGGYGHICVSVDNLQKACQRFDELGVRFVKRPEDGMLKFIAFIADPDGYLIEIIENTMNN